MTIRRFEEIEAWQLARKLAHRIWQVSRQKEFARDVDLREQINRSSGSTMDNIAEGFGRGGNREFIQFLYVARASNDEARSQLYRAFDRNYISKAVLDELVELSLTTGTKISNFSTYLQKAAYRGAKFK